MPTVWKLSLGILLLSTLIGPAVADDGPRYTVVPLQVYPGTVTEDTAYCAPSTLNDKGEAVGLAGAHGRFHAVRWDEWGRLFKLGTPTDKLDDARAINDKGQMVVNGSTGADVTARLYLVDAAGRARPLDTLPGCVLSKGEKMLGGDAGASINNAGQIAFNVQDKDGLPRRAMLYDHGKLTELGHLPIQRLEEFGCYVDVHALNSVGMAAGSSYTHPKPGDAPAYHAFLWRRGAMTDLGALPGYDGSTATALNNRGDVIGTMTRSAETDDDNPISKAHGFLWHDGVLRDLGALPGCAYTEPTGINDRGQIVGNSYNIQVDHDMPDGGVGYSRTGGASGSTVFLWQNGQMQDLQTLVPAGWELHSAVAIDNRGDILCTGYHAGMPSWDLGSGAFILRPR